MNYHGTGRLTPLILSQANETATCGQLRVSASPQLNGFYLLTPALSSLGEERESQGASLTFERRAAIRAAVFLLSPLNGERNEVRGLKLSNKDSSSRLKLASSPPALSSFWEEREQTGDGLEFFLTTNIIP